ncbi:galactose-1-phosphate uridylyltransferase [Shigella flexneri]
MHSAVLTRSPGSGFSFHRIAQTPVAGARETPAEQVSPAHDPDCFLCAGNARVTGDKTAITPGPSLTMTLRLMSDTPDAPETHDRLMRCRSARGTGRVICFSPDHGKTLRACVPALTEMVKTWQEQPKTWGNAPGGAGVGTKAQQWAALTRTPHGPIWANRFLPNEAKREDRLQKAYFADRTHQCSLSRSSATGGR